MNGAAAAPCARALAALRFAGSARIGRLRDRTTAPPLLAQPPLPQRRAPPRPGRSPPRRGGFLRSACSRPSRPERRGKERRGARFPSPPAVAAEDGGAAVRRGMEAPDGGGGGGGGVAWGACCSLLRAAAWRARGVADVQNRAGWRGSSPGGGAVAPREGLLHAGRERPALPSALLALRRRDADALPAARAGRLPPCRRRLLWRVRWRGCAWSRPTALGMRPGSYRSAPLPCGFQSR